MVDNGTNSVGVNRHLKELRDLFLLEQQNQQMQVCLTEIGEVGVQ